MVADQPSPTLSTSLLIQAQQAGSPLQGRTREAQRRAPARATSVRQGMVAEGDSRAMAVGPGRPGSRLGKVVRGGLEPPTFGFQFDRPPRPAGLGRCPRWRGEERRCLMVLAVAGPVAGPRAGVGRICQANAWTTSRFCSPSKMSDRVLPSSRLPSKSPRWSTCTTRTSWLSITSEMPWARMVSDQASRFRPCHSGSPHGSATASQKSLSVSIGRPRRSTINSLSVIAAG